MDDNTPLYLTRSVAKWVVVSIIDVKTTQLTADAIADHSKYDKDDLLVRVGAGAVGFVVSARLKPVTDKMVDKATDFAHEQWTKRKSKKTAKNEEK
jgi:hypothetical protein